MPANNEAGATIQGRTIHPAGAGPVWVWEVGPGPGAPALMLLHGWGATAALNWYGSFSYLGRRFRVVAPNLRGHGRHGRGAPRFTVEGCADDVGALIDALNLRRVVVVGYSMGGAVAQVLARRHPAHLAGIVLCATAASFARRPWLRPAVRAVGGAAATAARAFPGPAASVLRWRVAQHDRRAGARGWARAQALSGTNWALSERSQSDLAAFIEAGVALNGYDSSAWLPTLGVPSAVVLTTRDRVVAPWRQEGLAIGLGAKRYLVEGGHDAVVTQPEIFLPVLEQACTDFLSTPQRKQAETSPAASTTISP